MTISGKVILPGRGQAVNRPFLQTVLKKVNGFEALLVQILLCDL